MPNSSLHEGVLPAHQLNLQQEYLEACDGARRPGVSEQQSLENARQEMLRRRSNHPDDLASLHRLFQTEDALREGLVQSDLESASRSASMRRPR